MVSEQSGIDMDEPTKMIDALIEWYWTHGRLRAPEYALPARWIVELYRRRNLSAGLDARTRADKKAVAIWGPSQAGKSTMLAEFLDSREDDSSALSWPGGTPFRFRKEKRSNVSAFNPYNKNSDASGCVTEFEMVDEVLDPEHPVSIRLMDREQLLQTLAAGYLWECRLETEHRPPVTLDDQGVLSLANRFTADGAPTAERAAVELLLDATAAVNRLMEDQQPRWQGLQPNNMWKREIEHVVLAHTGLISNEANARSFIYHILWDNQDALNTLFEDLEQYAAKTAARFKDKPLHCSLALASLLVDIDAYRQMDSGSEEGSQEALQLIRSLRVVDKGSHYALVENENAGEPMFSGGLDGFGLFQALVWQLHLPLRADFLRQRSEKVADFLTAATILDVPGVTQKEKGSDQTKLDLATPDATREALLAQVIKRGKTVTIINRYAQEMRVDLVLLLARIMRPIPKTEQLIAGVQSIWNEIEPGYDPGSDKRPPIPVVLGMTFFSQLVNTGEEDGFKGNFENLDEHLEQLGPLTDPKNATIFATTYPFFYEGRIRDDCDRDEAFNLLSSKSWFRKRFSGQEGMHSLRAAIFDEDGGVGYLIATLLQRLQNTSLSELVARRISNLGQELSDLIAQAVPKRSDNDKYQEALRSLIGHIEQRLKDPVTADDDPAVEVSRHLRRIFEFDEKDFEPVPTGLDPMNVSALEQMVEYVQQQLAQWSMRPVAPQALGALGLDDKYRIDVLLALRRSVDTKEVAQWALSALDNLNGQDAARNARRFLAARCARALLRYQRADISPSNTDSDALQKTVARRFDEWSDPERSAQSSPHYERIIEPLLGTLSAIANHEIEVGWVVQPGDDEINQLAQIWPKDASATPAEGKQEASHANN